MTASICYIHPCHHWGKPLNPILGETYQAEVSDGSKVYVEQICHHPPISFMIQEGPDSLYRFSGYSTFGVRAFLNSVALDVGGQKKVTFPDGTEITYTNLSDTFQNTLIGTCHHMMHDRVEYIDHKNNIKGVLNVGDLKELGSRPRDYFSGHIEQNGEIVCSNI